MSGLTTPPTTSLYSPALCPFHGKLYVAWTRDSSIYYQTIDEEGSKSKPKMIDFGTAYSTNNAPALAASTYVYVLSRMVGSEPSGRWRPQHLVQY